MECPNNKTSPLSPEDLDWYEKLARKQINEIGMKRLLAESILRLVSELKEKP